MTCTSLPINSRICNLSQAQQHTFQTANKFVTNAMCMSTLRIIHVGWLAGAGAVTFTMRSVRKMFSIDLCARATISAQYNMHFRNVDCDSSAQTLCARACAKVLLKRKRTMSNARARSLSAEPARAYNLHTIRVFDQR